MADGVNLPPSGTGDSGVKASTQKVTADSSDVQDVALASVVGGVRTRVSAAAPLPVDDADSQVLYGALTETAPASDTASSGLNGRLQRIAQRLTSLIALLPASLGQKTSAASLAVTIASDQSALTVASHAVTNAGTFAVQADTELPTAAALGDTDANPTTTQVGSLLQGWSGSVWVRLKAGIGDAASATGLLNIVPMLYNGSTYDRFRGDTTNGLDVDVTRVGGNVATTSAASSQVDGHSVAIGSTTDAAATTTGSVIAQLRRIANAIVAGLPASLGQKTMANSTGVVIASDQSAIPVSGTISVSGTMPVSVAVGQEVDGHSANIGLLADASSANTLTGLLKNIKAALAGTLTISQANPVQAATATLANVAGSATSVTLQALNTSRKGLVIVNDSTAILYVKFGTTASTTSYTYFLAGSVGGVPATLELPAVTYTGRVDGIWASATGNGRITELT